GRRLRRSARRARRRGPDLDLRGGGLDRHAARRRSRPGRSRRTLGRREDGQPRLMPAATAHRSWRRPPMLIRDRRWRWSIYAFSAIYLVLAIWSVEVNWIRVYEGLERGWRFLQGFLVPDFTSRWRDIGSGLAESLTMTLTSTVAGVLISV